MNKEGALKKKMLTSHKVANECKSRGAQSRASTHKTKNPMPLTVDANEGQSRLIAILSKCNWNQGKNKTMQDQTLENHKRKNLMPATLDANEGKRRLNSIQAKCTQKQVQSILPMRKTMAQSSQRQDHNSVPMPGANPLVDDQLDILELQNLKKVMELPICSSMTIDQFLEKQGICVAVEEQVDIEPIEDDDGGNNMASDEEQFDFEPMEDDDGENNMTSDDDVADVEVGENNFVRDQVMDTDCDENGISKKKKSRGRTTCKAIHDRTWEEREEVTFDKGQPVGPTNKRVSELTNFLGTMARDRRFVSLLYTNWHAVPEPNINHMWNYVNSKFILPKDAKKWVMSTIREAWKRYKGNIKKKHFDKYDNIEDMLKNRPVEVPEAQFHKLIKYWSLPVIQSLCRKNSQNRKKQKFRHRMGPINFGRVRSTLRTTKGTNEDPTKYEIFVATRTGRKGKEVDSETQAAILELQNRQDAGETEEDAFEAVFGKDPPGRVRCYGRSVTATDLKKDAEIAQIKQQYNEEVTSLKNDIGNLKEEVHELRHIVKLLLQQCDTGLSPEEIEVLFQSTQRRPLHDANSVPGVVGHWNPRSSGSTHI